MVDEERPSIGGYPHLPAWWEEALLGLVLGFGRAVGRWLGRLRVGECVLHSSSHLDVVGTLQGSGKGDSGGAEATRSSNLGLMEVVVGGGGGGGYGCQGRGSS